MMRGPGVRTARCLEIGGHNLSKASLLKTKRNVGHLTRHIFVSSASCLSLAQCPLQSRVHTPQTVTFFKRDASKMKAPSLPRLNGHTVNTTKQWTRIKISHICRNVHEFQIFRFIIIFRYFSCFLSENLMDSWCRFDDILSSTHEKFHVEEKYSFYSV